MKLDHIGIAVRDIKAAEELFTKVFKGEVTWRGKVEEQGVEIVRIAVGGVEFELLHGTREDSAVSRFLEKRGEGIHHISFEVEDMEGEVERLKGLGLRPVSEKPTPGSKGALVFFFHPKSLHGILLELCRHGK